MRCILFSLFLILLAPPVVSAGTEPALPAGDGMLLVQSSHRSAPSYLLTSLEMDAMLQDEGQELPDWEAVSAGGAPKRWWPMALSLVLPGLGEATTGYTRGYFLIAADVASLGAAYHYNDEGDKKEEEYLAFADLYWSEEDWILAIETEDQAPYFGTDYQNHTDVPLWVSKEEDEREYYENLGKWDIFWYGWADSRPTMIPPEVDWNWTDPPPEFMTPLRDQYLDMRKASNDAYETRDRFLAVSLLLRVFSVLEVAYLEGFIGGKYSNDYDGPGIGGNLNRMEDGSRLNWFVDATRPTDSRLGLQLRY